MSRPDPQSPIDTARAHWGDDMPDWVRALADACTASSQNKVAARLDRSAALVSTVLRRTYRGSLATVEQLVRGVLMSETVDCPAAGLMPAQKCVEWQGKARAFANTNAERVAMYRACHRCARFRGGDQ